MATVDLRKSSLEQWLTQQWGGTTVDIHPASADASFRRYFRASHQGVSYILMDAPPEQEDCKPFVSISRLLETNGVHVPHIHAQDLTQGFLILDDFGTTDYLSTLNPHNAEMLYAEAQTALQKIQSTPADKLPHYNEALLRSEMQLFDTWFLQQHLGIQLTPLQQQQLEQSFQVLTQSALQQPRTFVHRDYHSRNLMLTPSRNPGIIDYQDAVLGPLTYDLVSLLRDCYIAWPMEQVEHWALAFHDQWIEGKGLNPVSDQQFLYWFDLMGLQRHLKVLGIFSRLNYRDGKPGYLADLPRTFSYVMDVSARHPETKALHSLLASLDIATRLAL